MASIKKTDHTGKDVEELEFSCTAGRIIKWHYHFEKKSVAVSKKS